MTDRMVSSFERHHFYATVGGAIGIARAEAGIGRDTLAQRAKLAKSTIENAENGVSCSLLVAARIADALDVPLDVLVPTEADAPCR
jgi:DNA-binding XRE family transcriptional regulator